MSPPVVTETRWRVAIANHRSGVMQFYEQPEERGRDAMSAALTVFEAVNPDCNEYGTTHGLVRCVQVSG